MIREKAAKGKTPYAISKEMWISKNTVKKYLEQDSSVSGGYPSRGSKLDPYKAEIDRLIEEGIFNCVVILERVQAKGYDGQISILKDYIRPYRPAKQIPAVQRYETEPGKQVQMDWGICQYMDQSGQIHKVSAFIIILGYRRMRYVEFMKRCDMFSLLHCILNAFEYYGGVPDTVLTDNMKTVVLGRESGAPMFHPGFLDFARDMGFVPKVCRIRRPQTKGKVEQLVDYVKDNFMLGREFLDFSGLNRQAKPGVTKRMKRSHTLQERPHTRCYVKNQRL